MTRDRSYEKQPEAEIDPRFPSGEWKGFYLQQSVQGRQWMTLAMQFAQGEVSGEGRDLVGQFTLKGSYDLADGRCLLTKTYPGSHQVIYEGSNEGDGKWLWGLWRIGAESGGFHLWPKGEPDPTAPELHAVKEAPRERKVRMGLPV